MRGGWKGEEGGVSKEKEGQTLRTGEQEFGQNFQETLARLPRNKQRDPGFVNLLTGSPFDIDAGRPDTGKEKSCEKKSTVAKIGARSVKQCSTNVPGVLGLVRRESRGGKVMESFLEKEEKKWFQWVYSVAG